MHTAAGIGATLHIKGDVTAEEPLVIAGRVTGSVTVVGHSLTIDVDAQIDGEVTGNEVLIHGHSKGRHKAERIVISDTAVVEGEIAAPVMSVANGAILQGAVDVEGRRPAVLSLAS